MRTIESKNIKEQRNAKYDDLQKDNKPDQVRRAFEHKPYAVDSRKVGVTGECKKADSKIQNEKRSFEQ